MSQRPELSLRQKRSGVTPPFDGRSCCRWQCCWGTRGACQMGGDKISRHGLTRIILVWQRVVNITAFTVFDGSFHFLTLRSRRFATNCFDSKTCFVSALPQIIYTLDTCTMTFLDVQFSYNASTCLIYFFWFSYNYTYDT